MRVHLIKKGSIESFVISHAQCRPAFADWLEKVKYADWDKPDDIKCTFGSADLLGNGSNRVIFDIGGNNYRMICKYVIGSSQIHLFVCWIGTHTEYSKLCKSQKQYSINIY